MVVLSTNGAAQANGLGGWYEGVLSAEGAPSQSYEQRRLTWIMTISRFQRLARLLSTDPGPLAQVIALRAVGA